MSSTEETAEGSDVDVVVCANCGIAEVDEIKLEDCVAVNPFDAVVINIRRNIESGTRKSARKGRQSYMTKKYSHSPMVVISGSARSVSCRCRLILKRVRFIHAAAN
jgi:hypothetical protein